MESVPVFRWMDSNDGKQRLYLIAHHASDIEFMIRAAGLIPEGIRWHEKDQVYFRIIKDWEFMRVKKVFP